MNDRLNSVNIHYKQARSCHHDPWQNSYPYPTQPLLFVNLDGWGFGREHLFDQMNSLLHVANINLDYREV